MPRHLLRGADLQFGDAKPSADGVTSTTLDLARTRARGSSIVSIELLPSAARQPAHMLPPQIAVAHASSVEVHVGTRDDLCPSRSVGREPRLNVAPDGPVGRNIQQAKSFDNIGQLERSLQLALE